MERLTRKDKGKGFYYIPNKCFRMASDRYYGEDDGFSDMLKRLAEFEDFMEEQGFESFEELNKKIKNLEYENGELKEQIGVLEEALGDKGE